MKSWIVPYLFLVAVSCSKQEEKTLAKERFLTESVYASATVQPDSLYQVFSAVSGILENVFVEEGDLVTKTNPLFEITNSTPKLNTQNARFALELARENYKGAAAILNSIKDEIEAAKLKYSNDSINYFRQRRLWQQRIGSEAQLEIKKLNYELASNQLRLLKSKYIRTEKELLTSVKQAQNNYLSASINTKDFTVTSKMQGKVYVVLKEPGEIVTSVQPLAAIGSANQFVIVLLVDEVDIVKIAKNQRVLIQLEAYDQEVFEAVVAKIYPKKDERNQTFKVEATFTNPPEVLYPGLSGEANIVIATKENALTIPKSYLLENNKVKTDEGLIRIEAGLQNMDFVEILSGIDANTHIYKPEK